MSDHATAEINAERTAFYKLLAEYNGRGMEDIPGGSRRRAIDTIL